MCHSGMLGKVNKTEKMHVLLPPIPLRGHKYEMIDKELRILKKINYE
jgi:hypothetical protein